MLTLGYRGTVYFVEEITMNITIAQFAIANIIDNRKDEKSAAFVALLKRWEEEHLLVLDTEKYTISGLALHRGPAIHPFYNIDDLQVRINELLTANNRHALDVPHVIVPGLATTVAEASIPCLRILLYLHSVAQGFDLDSINYSVKLQRSVPGKDWLEHYTNADGTYASVADDVLFVNFVINPAPMTAQVLEEAQKPRRALTQKEGSDVGAGSENVKS